METLHTLTDDSHSKILTTDQKIDELWRDNRARERRNKKILEVLTVIATTAAIAIMIVGIATITSLFL